MKYIIKEDRLQGIVDKVLDNSFGELYEDKKYTTDSTGEWSTTKYYKEGRQCVMIYRDNLGMLYVAREMTSQLSMFDVNLQREEFMVKDWFESRYELPVSRVLEVSLKSMN